ncbi:nuclear transport factor 2 family protein [Pseudemcibacter aquimaris]|uniref:nuclear transport factor 2 family protein n=1 Tax=Pseudemcibacter aquimaris TaxID=2857064 RepID=UPI0020116C88|nr:nuclear transport factor 2 family protein [Pseudemcibacter aquimaris]MCC3862097.1 nuclear transport factor 2 family protein [Pseudemcibacter aquimaris]WDU58850.1 nuclear transport factor 2 family protein [Pseudemcibacter aquimaris]
MMKQDAQSIKNLVTRYMGYWDSSDIDGLMSMYDKSMSYHDLPSGEVIKYDELYQFLKDTFELQSDPRIKLNETTVIEGNSAFIHWTQSFLSTDTGRNVKINGVELIKFQDGKIISIHEFYEYQTTASLLMPSPGTESYMEKMTKLGLSKEMVEQIKIELTEYLKKERPYLLPDLTLATVADRLGYTRNQISFVINHVLDKTFYDLLNGHRIDHAISRMSLPDNNLSILELGFDAGFNSVSGFYNAFKKQTSKTPAQYLRHLKR